MSGRDYNRQALRRQRIRKRALIVGVDVGKAFSAVGFLRSVVNSGHQIFHAASCFS
jgi:hypothetical protein